jgi:gluconolactonase
MDNLETAEEIARGLRFPEGPIAMPNGDVLVVEIAAGRLTRVRPDGSLDVIAETGGGPNGAAIGPDGRCYICNNGGFRWHERDGLLLPGLPAENYAGGWIEAVDLESGRRELLYRDCCGVPLNGPNDLVFDSYGGIWFTDHGKTHRRSRDRGAVYYARPDGSWIREAIFPLDAPNGIGLSPDGESLYVSETHTARLWVFEIEQPGYLRQTRGKLFENGRLVVGLGGYRLFDSLAVEASGNICVATVPDGISVISPDGSLIEQISSPDPITTNLCFGGPDLGMAFITLSSSGRLISAPWPRPGLPLHFLNA